MKLNRSNLNKPLLTALLLASLLAILIPPVWYKVTLGIIPKWRGQGVKKCGPSSVASSLTTSEDGEREALDLTTAGADVPLPALDHPIFDGVKQASELSSGIGLDPSNSGSDLSLLDLRLSAIEHRLEKAPSNGKFKRQ